MSSTPLIPIPDPVPELDPTAFFGFVSAHLQPRRGGRVAWQVLYEHYSDWWSEAPEPGPELDPQTFSEAMGLFCERAGVRIRKKRGRVLCLDVRLIDPSVKAIAGPNVAA